MAAGQVRPKKRFGQNFLRSEGVLGRILEAADLKKSDVVLEIGSGTGFLTKALAQRAKRVVAVEKDPDMVELLKENLRGMPNVEIVRADILDWSDRTNRTYRSYKIVANLPYYIASPVIRKFLEARHKPALMVLMVQKEVAQRICAKPPNMSLLAVAVQFYGGPEIVSYVKAGSFWPAPKVDSAILKIVPKKHPAQKIRGRDFFDVVKTGFKQPRKQLQNNLSAGLGLSREQTAGWLEANKIDPAQRAETLSVDEWIRLAKTMPRNTIEK